MPPAPCRRAPSRRAVQARAPRREARTLFQVLFPPCVGLAVGPQLCWFLALQCDGFTPCQRGDCAHAQAVTVFSWPGLGGCGDSARLTEPVPGTQASAEGCVRPAPSHSRLGHSAPSHLGPHS